MEKLTIKSLLVKVTFILCLLALPTVFLNAQLRTRTMQDSILASINHYWYLQQNYQFQVQYPKLTEVPPLSTGMPLDILLSYIYVDSLMRTTDRNTLYSQQLNYWRFQHIKSDTLVSAVKCFYNLIDYDPIRFNQFNYNTSKPYYSMVLKTFSSLTFELLSNLVINDSNRKAFRFLTQPDYILKVHINSIDSLPRKEYSKGILMPNEWVYQVNATVLDTLKGKVFQNCNSEYLTKKDKKDKMLTAGPSICFTYDHAPYSNISDWAGYQIDQSLLDGTNKLRLFPGMDLIVTLYHCNYYWDYNYDYFELTLITVLSVVNDQVKDINNTWSNSLLINYPDWKFIFQQKKSFLLNGGY